MNQLNEEQDTAETVPDRLWVDLRTQHAFTENPDPYIKTVEYGPMSTFNGHYEGLMRAALQREQDAATQMRDKCVEAVKAATDGIVACRPHSQLSDLISQLIEALEQEK